MSQIDDLDAILQRIEDGQQAEENFAALCEILRGGRRREVLQKLAKYNLQIQEVAGGDLQIGDRIYNGWTEQAFEALLLAIRSQIAELLQSQPSKSDLNADQAITDFGEMPSCPYQGLSAFQEENAEFFFGREAFIEDVVREDGGVRQGLVSAVKTKPLVAVVGASGSGKSSLVFAGLLPQLAQEASWLICKLRPGYPDKRSFHNLAAALLSLKASEPNADPLVLLSQRAKALREGTVTLQDVVAEIIRHTPTTRCLLLVIDQFEELFTLCAEEERQPLIEVLLAGVKAVSGLKIVLTLRADFCGQAYAYRPLADALHEADLKLGPMNREELRSAIVQPATKKGVQLEAGLVDRILDDVGQEPGNLPLLEFALTQLWAKQRRGQLTHESYLEIGGVAKALANHAEAVYNQLSQTEQKQVQQIFLPLVRLGEGTEDTRQLATRAEVGNWELVIFLASEKARLVVTGSNEQSGEETVEVMHEALIREWQRLRQWVNENRDKLRQKQKVEMASDEWKKKGKSKDYLLQGKSLAEARLFQKESTEALALSRLAEELIQSSIRQRRNNRLKFIGFGLVVPLGLAMFLGFAVERDLAIKRVATQKETKVKRLWETVIFAQKQGNSLTLTQALQDLVKAGESLANSNFSSTNLSNVSLSNANLSNANLSNANLSNVSLSNANLSNANLSNANLNRINAAKANFSGNNLSGLAFYKANFSNANLSRANLRRTRLDSAQFYDANLGSANLIEANIKNTSLNGADLSNAKLYAAQINGTTFIYSNLRGASLDRTDVINSDLSGADLNDASLIDAFFKDTDFRGVNLTKANITGAYFLNIKNLTSEQVKTAQNWERANYDKELCKELGLKNCRTK